MAFSKYRAWREKKGITHEKAMLFHVLLFSIYTYVVVGFYTGGLQSFVLPGLLNTTLGYVSVIMVLFAMSMSSICYFWDFADKYLIYRKQFLIVGFVYAALHFALSMLLVQKNVGLDVYFNNPNVIFPFFLSVAALAILMFLTIISYKRAISYLGKDLWYSLLRLGYVALIFAVMHMGTSQGGEWSAWLLGHRAYVLPPFGLLIFMAAITLFTLRFFMWVDMKRKK